MATIEMSTSDFIAETLEIAVTSFKEGLNPLNLLNGPKAIADTVLGNIEAKLASEKTTEAAGNKAPSDSPNRESFGNNVKLDLDISLPTNHASKITPETQGYSR